VIGDSSIEGYHTKELSLIFKFIIQSSLQYLMIFLFDAPKCIYLTNIYEQGGGMGVKKWEFWTNVLF